MSSPSPPVRLVSAIERITDRVIARLGFIAPLATRITLGLGFLRTGQGKLANLDRTTAFFAELGIPAPHLNALFIGGLEVVGGAALLVGLFTRSFATLLSGTMVVALLTADRADFLASWGSMSEASPTDVASYVFLLLLAGLVVFGPGAASLDALVRARLLSSTAGAARPSTPTPGAARPATQSAGVRPLVHTEE